MMQHVLADGMHQVCLAEAHPAIQEQGVVGEECRRQIPHRRAQRLDCDVQRDLHRGGIDVVRRLAQVHMVVRVNVGVVAARVVHQLEGAVGDHLVRVHVGRRPGAALDHVDHEVLVMASGANLLCRSNDDLRDPAIEQAELGVRQRSGFLHHRQRFDEHGEFAKGDAGDREVLHRPQRLNAVQRVFGNVPLAEEVMLAARPGSGETERASVANEGGIGRGESLRYRPRGARDERRVQGRILLQHLVNLVGGDRERFGSLHRARTGAVR